MKETRSEDQLSWSTALQNGPGLRALGHGFHFSQGSPGYQ
jgi:hypothetical protein